MHARKRLYFVGIVLMMAVVASPSVGYIHFPPATMQKMCKQSTNIRVLEAKKHDKEKGVIVYEVDKTLKGKSRKGMSFKHAIRKNTLLLSGLQQKRRLLASDPRRSRNVRLLPRIGRTAAEGDERPARRQECQGAGG
jgi:hypothetical protein